MKTKPVYMSNGTVLRGEPVPKKREHQQRGEQKVVKMEPKYLTALNEFYNADKYREMVGVGKQYVTLQGLNRCVREWGKQRVLPSVVGVLLDEGLIVSSFVKGLHRYRISAAGRRLIDTARALQIKWSLPGHTNA